MTDASEYTPVDCPVSDCEYTDAVRSVAGHVGRSDDPDHSWHQLGYDGARDFVMTEKRRQRGELDERDDPRMESGSQADSDSQAESESGSASESSESSGTEADDFEQAGELDFEEADEPDFELGFERDALILLELASRYDLSSLDELGTGQLADLYALLADLKNSADDARTEVRDVLLDEPRQAGTVSATFGRVSRYTREYRRLEDEGTVQQALDEAGVDPDSVKSFDKSKLRDAVEETDLDEESVFEVDERAQVRIAGANEHRRRERFDRLDPAIRALAEDDE